ncbi:MAG: DUF4252 domain-containing protein [Paramuribaculum sp.]|nr:DUF4252 domain-containing protein [Paramuribaculum sp.]
MKRLLTLLVVITAGFSIARADYLEDQMNNLVNQNVVSEIYVSKAMLKMLPPGIQNRIPMLNKLDGLTAVTVLTAADKVAVQKCQKVLSNSLNNAITTTGLGKLLEIKDSNEYSAVFGTTKSDDTKDYSRIVVYTETGDNGQVVILNGTITPEVLEQIAQSILK